MLTDGWTDGRTEGRTNGWMDGPVDQRTDGPSDGRMDRQKDRQTDRRTDKGSYKIACPPLKTACNSTGPTGRQSRAPFHKYTTTSPYILIPFFLPSSHPPLLPCPFFSSILQCNFQNFPKCSTIFHIVPQRCTMFQNVPQCTSNTQKYQKISKNA